MLKLTLSALQLSSSLEAKIGFHLIAFFLGNTQKGKGMTVARYKYNSRYPANITVQKQLDAACNKEEGKKLFSL